MKAFEKIIGALKMFVYKNSLLVFGLTFAGAAIFSNFVLMPIAFTAGFSLVAAVLLISYAAS